ncbi:MAG: hypothetical protein GEU81_05980 [Nitriliruptorales bacterium]|nr:hypothetical protein [Nitriliruptorales bacterium]
MVLKVAGAQLPNVVGDIQGNAERIRDAVVWAEAEGADMSGVCICEGGYLRLSPETVSLDTDER